MVIDQLQKQLQKSQLELQNAHDEITQLRANSEDLKRKVIDLQRAIEAGKRQKLRNKQQRFDDVESSEENKQERAL